MYVLLLTTIKLRLCFHIRIRCFVNQFYMHFPNFLLVDVQFRMVRRVLIYRTRQLEAVARIPKPVHIHSAHTQKLLSLRDLQLLGTQVLDLDTIIARSALPLHGLLVCLSIVLQVFSMAPMPIICDQTFPCQAAI